MFAWTNDFVEENELGLEVSHLTTLATQFEKYFPADWDFEKHDCNLSAYHRGKHSTTH
jgi:hypothetical protein